MALSTGLAHAQTPPPSWQQAQASDVFEAWESRSVSGGEEAFSDTPVSEYGEAGEVDDACCACRGCGDCRNRACLNTWMLPPLGGVTLPHDDWVRAEALLWWTKGGKIPPLLTSSPDDTPQAQAGVLGQPNTVVLLGNQGLNEGLRAGERVSFGSWLDANDNLGVEFSYLSLGRSNDRSTWTSDGSPILARPFFDVDAGAQDAHLIAYPDLAHGTFSCTSTSDFQIAGVLMRRAIARAPNYRVELLAGYRFQQLTEGLDIADTASGTSSTIQVLDQFHSRNDFHGGEIGIATAYRQCRWSFDANLKLAFGNTYSRNEINGWTTIDGVGYSGGLLALPSNWGVHSANQFSLIPEVGVTFGYDLTRHLRATVGYTFIYWNNVTRPGNQIDLGVAPSQFPPATQAASKPAFVQHNTDFWAQGINLGLDYRF
jgi:hypothetical protein